MKDLSFLARSPTLRCRVLTGLDFAAMCRSSTLGALVAGSCSSTRDFAPRFFRTAPRGATIAHLPEKLSFRMDTFYGIGSIRKPHFGVDADTQATVDKDHLSGEETAPVRGEEADKLCHLLGLADPLHWDGSQKPGSRRIR